MNETQPQKLELQLPDVVYRQAIENARLGVENDGNKQLIQAYQKALQEQNAQITALNAKIEELEKSVFVQGLELDTTTPPAFMGEPAPAPE